MIELEYRLKNQPIKIRVCQRLTDLWDFIDFVESNPVMGFDTETTGLDWWNHDRGFRIRLAQFGNGTESWVLPVEIDAEFGEAVKWALHKAKRLIAHNGTFDQHVSEATLGVTLEEVAPKLLDTKLIAHLVDPRKVKEKGPGLKLEELVKFYIDGKAAEEVKGSMRELAKKYKVKKEDIWTIVKTFDLDYLLYAGMDPVWAFRLLHILLPKVPKRSLHKGLISWEHRLAHITAKMERKGYLADEGYIRKRIAELTAEKEKWEAVAKQWVENPGSGQQLVAALLKLGVKLDPRKKTKPSQAHPEGQYQTTDEVLSEIDHPLAGAVMKMRRAAKWCSTWFEKALAGMDSKGYVHASVNSLEARTARMSITGAIPAQTFPAGDGYVRHSFLADEGEVSASIDFGNMELRVLAAASQDPTMMKAFLNDEDLHNITAIAAFGPMPPGATKHPKRKAGKGTNFTVCFGGGWNAVSTQWDIPEDEAKRAVEAFWEAYPGTKKLSRKLMDEARKYGFIWTATGRRLPVDKDRPYAALNYYIQSSARDITARALIRLDKAGFTPYMRLPIHDEIVFSFPADRAKELTEKAARLMEFKFKGLLIPADGEIGKRSWGSVLELEDSKH